MTGEEIFDIWAPEPAAWSPWCKPVLFAHLDGATPAPEALAEATLSDFEGLPKPTERIAVVVDLPGPTSVAVGLKLAERLRYRPVPLFNAAPPPFASQPAQVEVHSILAALFHGTEALARLELSADAPPIFLLDSRRRFGDDGLYEAFDNRSVSFPTDFPSANRLRASGIERVLLIQATDDAVEPDLAHTLLRWQEAGIVISRKGLSSPEGAVRIDVPKPSWFRSALHRLFEMAGLRRNALGGFGGFPPQAAG